MLLVLVDHAVGGPLPGSSLCYLPVASRLVAIASKEESHGDDDAGCNSCTYG